MESLLASHRGEVVALEDVQRLAHGRAAARRGSHRVHVETAVAHVRRLALDRAVVLQVLQRHHAGPPDVVRRRRGIRVLHGVDDRVRDVAAVQLLHAVLRDELVRVREVRIAKRRADVVRRAVRVEVERGRGRDVVEPVERPVGLVEERLVDDEPVPCDADRRLQHLRELHRPVLLECLSPRRGRSGHADGHAAPARVVERERHAVLPERRRRHRL